MSTNFLGYERITILRVRLDFSDFLEIVGSFLYLFIYLALSLIYLLALSLFISLYLSFVFSFNLSLSVSYILSLYVSLFGSHFGLLLSLCFCFGNRELSLSFVLSTRKGEI